MKVHPPSSRLGLRLLPQSGPQGLLEPILVEILKSKLKQYTSQLAIYTTLSVQREQILMPLLSGSKPRKIDCAAAWLCKRLKEPDRGLFFFWESWRPIKQKVMEIRDRSLEKLGRNLWDLLENQRSGNRLPAISPPVILLMQGDQLEHGKSNARQGIIQHTWTYKWQTWRPMSFLNQTYADICFPFCVHYVSGSKPFYAWQYFHGPI